MRVSKGFLMSLAAVTVAGGAVLMSLNPRAAMAEMGLPMSQPLNAEAVAHLGLDDVFDAPTIAEYTACAAIPACGNSDTSRVVFLTDRREVSATPTSRIQRTRTERRVNAKGDSVISVNRRTLELVRGRTVMTGLDSVTRVDYRRDGSVYSAATNTRRYSNVTFADPAEKRAWPVEGLITLAMENTLYTPGNALPRVYEDASALMFDGTSEARLASGDGLLHYVNLAARTMETRQP